MASKFLNIKVEILIRGGFQINGFIKNVDPRLKTILVDKVEFVGKTGNIVTNDSLTIHSSIISDLHLPKTTHTSQKSETLKKSEFISKEREENFELIDTLERLELALQHIKKYDVIALDTEGVDLGREGQVTVLQIGTVDKIYLIDILALGEQAFDGGLRDILENEEVVKIMYDCRKDSDALYHLHKVTLKNVFDCQVADIIIRRNMTGMMPGYVQGYVRSLKAYLGFNEADLQSKVDGKLLMIDPNVWATRPLTATLQRYAAFDVAYIHILRDIMLELMGFEYNVAVEKYLGICRDYHFDSQHIIPNFESDILRYLFRNMRTKKNQEESREKGRDRDRDRDRGPGRGRGDRDRILNPERDIE